MEPEWVYSLDGPLGTLGWRFYCVVVPGGLRGYGFWSYTTNSTYEQDRSRLEAELEDVKTALAGGDFEAIEKYRLDETAAIGRLTKSEERHV